MTVDYYNEKTDTMKPYLDSRNSGELDRDEATKVAKRLATSHGFARVLFGATVVESYGCDLRHR